MLNMKQSVLWDIIYTCIVYNYFLYLVIVFFNSLINFIDSWWLIAPQELMKLPIASGSIEAWDFLSIDSQVCFHVQQVSLCYQQFFFLSFFFILFLFWLITCYYIILQTYGFSDWLSIVKTLSGDACLMYNNGHPYLIFPLIDWFFLLVI